MMTLKSSRNLELETEVLFGAYVTDLIALIIRCSKLVETYQTATHWFNLRFDSNSDFYLEFEILLKICELLVRTNECHDLLILSDP